LTQTIPVNNDILKWARETCGLSIAEVARRLKKNTGDIENWEQGISSPTYPQLEKLAYNIYRRPTAVFFFPAIPQEPSSRAEFRTLPEQELDAMPPEIIKLYKRAKVYQLNLQELDNTNNVTKAPRLVDRFSLTINSNLVELAKEIRDFLKIDLHIQTGWKNTDIAIEAWRNALIPYGVNIFKDAFKNNNYSGLSLYDEHYPVILINNSMPKTRQIFTIFHEIGHLLFKSGGVDILQESFIDRLQSDYYAIEQKCNEFAGEFLFPAALFQEVQTSFSEQNLDELANRFKVSREVVLRKYFDFNLITSDIYKFYTEKWLKAYLSSRDKVKTSDPGGDPYYTKIAYLGSHYINLAFSQYYQGKIDIETLSDYLNIKVGNIPTLERYVLR